MGSVSHLVRALIPCRLIRGRRQDATHSVSPGEHSLGTDTFPDAEPLGWQKDPILPGGLREVVGRCDSSGRDLLAGEGARMLRAV